jgi:hypothetical protein
VEDLVKKLGNLKYFEASAFKYHCVTGCSNIQRGRSFQPQTTIWFGASNSAGGKRGRQKALVISLVRSSSSMADLMLFGLLVWCLHIHGSQSADLSKDLRSYHFCYAKELEHNADTFGWSIGLTKRPLTTTTMLYEAGFILFSVG